LQTPKKIFADFDVVRIDMGEKAQDSHVEKIGRIPSSIILLRLMRRYRQQYGGYMEGTRVVVHASPDAGERIRPLMAGNENEIYRSSFGKIEYEENRRKTKSGAQKPALDEVTEPIEERKYEGYYIPKSMMPPDDMKHAA